MPDTAPKPAPALRVWPGIVAASLLLIARFGVKWLIPGFEGFGKAINGTFIAAALILLWWLFASRAPWIDRLGGLLLMVGTLAGAWAIRDVSMGPQWLVAYALPLTLTTFVGVNWLTQDMPHGRRRKLTTVALVAVAGLWALFRTDGVDGDHNALFAPRWTTTAEERLADVDLKTASGETGTLADGAPAWPGFRGLHRDGHAAGTHIATDWQTTAPEELWRHPVGPGWSSFAVHGDRLYTQEQRGELEAVSCYGVDDGKLIWSHTDKIRFFEAMAGAGPRSTPALGHGRVYALGATGRLNALDAADGSLIWSTDVAEDGEVSTPMWGFSGSPLVVGDLLMVPASGRLLVYDTADGSLRAQGPDDGEGYASPQLFTLAGEPQVVFGAGAGLTGFSTTGERLWHHEWKGFPMMQPAQTAEGDLVFNATEANGVRRLAIERRSDGWSAGERWTSTRLKPYFNDFVLHKGHLYGFDGRILACLDLETGERVWKGGRYGNGQMLLLPDQDLLLVMAEKGEVALVDAKPDGYNERAKITALPGKTWNHPVVVGDRLFVRNGEEMVAYRLPPA